MKFTLFLVALIVAIVGTKAQNCRMTTINARPGQSFCETLCSSDPNGSAMKCDRVDRPTRVSYCPSNCCRIGNQCRYM